MVLPVLAEINVIPDLVHPAVADRQRPLEPHQVRLTGLLGERIGLCEKNRLLTIDEDLLLDGFRERPGEHPWIGEHVGKWMHAATLAWVYTGDAALREKLDRVAAGLIAAQLPDGYLGTYLEKDRWTSWDVWSHKYDLIGLLTYHRYTGHKPALAACRKIGDLLCHTFGRDRRDIIKAGEHVGMAATSVLEPMVLLYRATGEKRYLDFCDYILWAWDQPHGPQILSRLKAGQPVSKVGNAKAYEMLSNLVGLCELYRTTGREGLLPPVVHAWDDVVARRLYISGSASQGEFFRDDHFLPNDEKAHIMETCVTVTWIQLNAQLLRLTGEPRYADELERTVYNQLLFVQKPDGSDFSYFGPLEDQRVWKPFGKREIHCCRSSGPRGLALVPTFAYGVNDDGVVVNFYESGSADVVLKDGSKVRIEQASTYLQDGRTVLAVKPEAPSVFKIARRHPSWCLAMAGSISRHPDRTVKLPADQPKSSVDADRGAGYDVVSQSQPWPGESYLNQALAMPVRIIEGAGTNQGKIALMVGPLVLAADEALNSEVKPFKTTAIAAASAGVAAKGVFESAATGQAIDLYRVKACTGEGGTSPVGMLMMPLAHAGSLGTWYQVWFPKTTTGCGE